MPSGAYEDPQGRFSLPLVGDWTRVETAGPVGQFTLADPPLELYVGALDSDDLEAGVSAALELIGIDTSALSLSDAVPLPPWTAYFYSLGDGRGVTVAAQERDGTTYALIMTGDETVTSVPPPQVMETIAGFAFVDSSPERGPLAYEDPQGRFSFPLTGNWTQIETDGTYARFALADPPADMHIVAVESDDLEAGIDAALEQIGVDPAALTSTVAGESLGRWFVFQYSLGDGQGVTVLAQMRDSTTYAIIATGRADVVNRAEPPADVLHTIAGFAFSGQETDLPSTVEEFEAYIDSFVGDVPPGLSIAIVFGGDVIHANGFGLADGPQGMAATPDTVYQWGSMVKMVTVTAIMQLVDQGLIDLDAPISDYLDYFPIEYPITTLQLLNHSAGLPENDVGFRFFNLDGEPVPDPDLAAREYVAGFTGPIFEPGSASAYANPHIMLIGQIIAEASEQPYTHYVQEHILAPLGMDDTDFTYSSEPMIADAAAHAIPATQAEAFVAAVGEAWEFGDAADLIRETDDRYAWLNRVNIGAAYGGLKGPPSEAARFMQMHLNGGELEGVRILSPESVALMQEIQLSTAGEPLPISLGWFVVDDAEHPYVEHAGGGPGIRSLMRLYPDDGLGIVLMSNAAGYDDLPVMEAAANVVFTMMEGN
jgi:CubicO group peptidase (beta-lactamase class C family)